MKKLIFIFTVGFLVFSLSGCGCSKKNGDALPADTWNYEAYGVKETGLVIDITEMNQQSATTTPGDVLYLKLTGEAGSKKQWSVVSPTSGDYIMLKDHKVNGLGSTDAEDGQFTDEWWLKIENQGEFEIKFNYGAAGKEAEDSFSFIVVSQ